MGCSAQDDAFLHREGLHVLIGIDQLVALLRRHITHAAYRAVDRLAAVGRQLFELLKKLAAPLFLILCQVLPGLHAIEHAFLLIRRQAGKMLQAVLQSLLLLGWKPAELGIIFKCAALLRRGQIFISA